MSWQLGSSLSCSIQIPHTTKSHILFVFWTTNSSHRKEDNRPCLDENFTFQILPSMKHRVIRQNGGQQHESAWDRQKDSFPGDSFSWIIDRKILVGCIIFRLLNALLLQTFFNPDEYWQSVEVAHRITFGYVGKRKEKRFLL